MTHSCCSQMIRSSIKLRLTTDERLTNNWRTTDGRLMDDLWEADVNYKRLMDDDWLTIVERLKYNWRTAVGCFVEWRKAGWTSKGRLKDRWVTNDGRRMDDWWWTWGQLFETDGRLNHDWWTPEDDKWLTNGRMMDYYCWGMTDGRLMDDWWKSVMDKWCIRETASCI